MTKEIVLVTGANSGIGLEITKLLNSQSKEVLAGVRRKETFPIFSEMNHVTPIELDVTKQSDIVNLVSYLDEQNLIVKGLVNNAGTTNSPQVMYYTSLKEMKQVFEVNVFAIHNLTKSLLTNLMQNSGRVVIIGSISSILTYFGSGTYSMTKHALASYADSLSYELHRFGVKISLIEPGNYQSNIGNGNLEKIVPLLELKDNPYLKELTAAKNHFESSDSIPLPVPVDVAKAVYDALYSERPKLHYLVTDNKMETEITIKKAIVELLQLNKDSPFAYTIDELCGLLKENAQDIEKEHLSFIPPPLRDL